MNEVVLDASAFLALLNEEPGADVVADALGHAAISAVNVSEVVAKLGEEGISSEAVRSALEELKLDVHPFDTDQAYVTGALRAQTKHLGLSFGDRACLSLGRLLSRPVLTTDRSWQKLRLGIEVQRVR